MVEPDYDYSGKTVVITGGTSGIGRKVAIMFGKSGATVLNADIDSNPKNGDTPTHELIQEHGGHSDYIPTDVSEIDDIRSVIKRADAYGGVDIMINNAGIMKYKPIQEVTQYDFEQLFDINVKGVFFGTQLAAQDMIERGTSGCIINTASISSNLAQHNQAQYDATKGAVRMITRSLALQYADHNIRVNGVAPGQIATEFTEGWSSKAKKMVENDELLKPVPLGEAGTPEDVAGAYLFLASDAAQYITGEHIHVDGGWQIC